MKTCRLQARNASGLSRRRPGRSPSTVRIAPSWLYQVGSPIGRRNDLMIGDIHRPQRSTSIMFSRELRPARRCVKSARIGAVFLPEVGRHEGPVDREEPGGIDH